MAQTGTALGVFLIGMVLLSEMLPDRAAAPGGQSQPVIGQSSEPDQASEPVDLPDPGAGREVVGNGNASFVIRRAPDSHFYADAEVNGAMIHFLVDTGATGILLTQGDAERAGISGGEYTAKAVGVGGEISLMPATAEQIALGPHNARNVPVMVAKDSHLPVSLLGQSYLSRIGTVSISGDAMTLQ